MKEYTLVIMAAGLGSRFKGGIKQLEPVGPNGEVLMDYAIYDAYQAGFRKIVFIIREEFQEILQTHFKELPSDLTIAYVYQKVEDLPDGFHFEERTKPWGTGHAILCCKNEVKGPFVVINGDDYYGSEVFSLLYDQLQKNEQFCMAGYFLKNTLSNNGGVNRAICKVLDGTLQSLEETYQIVETDGIITGQDQFGTLFQIDPNCYCSMNCFGFTPCLFETLEAAFPIFLKNLKNPIKDEFLLPDIIQGLISKTHVPISVVPTNGKWFGMTYQEDKKSTIFKIEQLIEKGIYPRNLWKK